MNGTGKLSVFLAVLMLPVASFATPALQIDCAEDGTRCDYVDGAEQSLIATQTTFTITAMATPGGRLSDDEILTTADIDSNTFFLAVALTGVDNTPEALAAAGNLTINGTTQAIADWQGSNSEAFVWGTPPGTDPTLPDHSIYETWYIMLDVNFTALNCQTVNVETGETGAAAGSYCVGFDFDVSGLAEGVNLHFDLLGYNDKEKLVFAPFSHDAGTNISVPEPGTLSLLGLGLLMIGFSRKRRRLT